MKRLLLPGLLALALLSSAFAAAPEPPKVNLRDLLPHSLRHAPNPAQPPAEVRAPIEHFFNALKEGESQQAYDALLANTRLIENKENVHVLVSKTDQALALYGKVLSFEVYDNYAVGSNLLVLTYLTNHAIQPLRWRFVYYRPERVWGLIDVRVDDVLEDLIGYY